MCSMEECVMRGMMMEGEGGEGFEDGGQVGVDILHSCFREYGGWEVWGVMRYDMM